MFLGEIWGTLRLVDHWSLVLNSAERQMARFVTGWNVTGVAIAATGDYITRAITLPVAAATGAVFKFGKDFETAMTRIETLVGLSRESVAGLSKEVLALSGVTGRAPQELGEALYFITSSGFAAGESIDVLTASAKAAAIGLGDTKTVADAVTTAISAYGRENLTAEEAVRVMIATVREGKAEADKIAGAMGRTIPIAALLGVRFQDLGSFIAATTRVGLNAEQSVTALRGALTAMIQPTEKQEKAFASLSARGLLPANFGLAEMRRIMREEGLAEAFIKLITATKGNEEAINAIIGDMRAMTGVLGAYGEQAETTLEIQREIRTDLGELEKGFARVQETLDFRFSQALARMQTVAIAAFESLKEGFKALFVRMNSFIDILERAVAAFDKLPESTKATIFGFTLFVAALGPILAFSGHMLLAFTALSVLLGKGSIAIGLGRITTALVGTPGLVLALGAAAYAVNEFIKAWGDMQQLKADQIVREAARVGEAFARAREMASVEGPRGTVATREELKAAQLEFDHFRSQVLKFQSELAKIEAEGARFPKAKADEARANLLRARHDLNIFLSGWRDLKGVVDEVATADPPPSPSPELSQRVTDLIEKLREQIRLQEMLREATSWGAREWIEFAASQGLTAAEIAANDGALAGLARRLHELTKIGETDEKVRTAGERALKLLRDRAQAQADAMTKTREAIKWQKFLTEATIDGGAGWVEFARAEGLTIEQTKNLEDPLTRLKVELYNLKVLTGEIELAQPFREFDAAMREARIPEKAREFTDTFMELMKMSGRTAEEHQARLRAAAESMRSLFTDEQWTRLQAEIDNLTDGARWTEWAKLMADAFGEAFGDMGTDVARFANQFAQLMAMLEQFATATTRLEKLTAGLGIGTAVGGMFGGSSNFGQAGGAIGGLVGGTKGFESLVSAISPALGPYAPLIGAALGTVLGSLVKRGADEALAHVGNLEGRLQPIVSKIEGKLGEGIRQLVNGVAEGVNAVLDQFGALLRPGAAQVQFKIRDDVITVFAYGLRQSFKSIEEAINFAILEIFKREPLLGIDPAVAQAINKAAQDAGDSIEQFQSDIASILRWRDMGLTSFASDLRATITELQVFRATIERLGLDVARVDAEIANKLARAVVEYGDSLLGFLDEFYEDARIGEELRRTLQQATFQLRLAELKIEFQTLLALNALTAEVAAQIQGIFDWIDANPPVFPDPGRDERRRAREQKQAEHARRLEQAWTDIGTPLSELRSNLNQLDESLTVLRNNAGKGAYTVDELNARLAELQAYATADFGGRLLSFLDEYYGETEIGQRMLLTLQQLNFQLRLVELRTEYEFLKARGLLTAEFIEQADAAFRWIDTHLPKFGEDVVEELEEVATAVESFLQRIADAANAPEFQTRSAVLRLFQQLFDALPDEAEVRRFRVAMETRVIPTTAAQPFAIAGRAYEELIVPILEWQEGTMSVEEARFEIAKAIQILELEVLRAQLMAAQLFTGPLVEIWNTVMKAVIDSSYQFEETVVNAGREFAESARQAYTDFQSMWNTLILGQGGENDPVAQLAADFAELRKVFNAQSLFDKWNFLRGRVPGLDTGPGGILTYNGQPLTHAVADALFRAFVEPIETLRLKELFDKLEKEKIQPILDFFDELRVGRAGLTATQQYEAALSEFQKAVAAGDIQAAVDFARMLTGDIGVAMFGSASQAFQDLVNMVVTQLGGFLPEGPPEDLLAESLEEERITNRLLADYIAAEEAAERRAEIRHEELLRALESYLAAAGRTQ